MILKISMEDNKWVYLDGINELMTLGVYEYNSDYDIINKNGGLFHADRRFLGEGWRTIAKNKDEEPKKACLAVRVVKKNGNEKLLAFAGSAYLLNDEGKTIESL